MFWSYSHIMSRDFVETAQDLFKKSFSFKLRNITLPPAELLFNSEPWNVPELMEMKEDLNKIKCLLDNEDIIEWRRHTKYTNYAGKILSEVRYAADPEMLTQAWLKFYEIVSRYPIVPETENFYTFHLCEAPGAFIAALNHYLVLRRKKEKWLWMANTLNPYYEGNSYSSAIMDDQFIIDTLQNWIFGGDNKGDIMDPMYLEDLQNKVDGAMQLVTADGSFDCQGNPNEQEKTVSSLHYCEIVIALHLLNEGGCFVIKMFTMFESESLCNMFLLNSVFEEVNVFKPATSKSGNSEVYVVCIKFKGREKMEPSFLEVLRQHMGQNPNQVMFPKEFLDKNETFIAQMLKCTQKFKDFQKKTIQQNIELKKKNMTEDEIYFLHNVKKECAKFYLKYYNLEKIEPEGKLLRGSKISQVNKEMRILETKLKGGSLNQRQHRKDKGPTARISFLKECLSTLQERTDTLTVLKKKVPSNFNGCRKNQIITGRPYERILNSKFCFPSIIEIWNEIIHYKQIMPLSCCATNEDDWNWDQLQNKKNDVFSNLQNSALFYTSGGEDMPELKGLIKNLNYNGKVTPICENTQCNDKKLIFIGIPTSDIEYNEVTIQKTLTDRIREMLKVLKEDDSLVLSLHGVLSRFVAGIIYLLCELFSEALVINPEENSSLLANQIWIFSYANIKYLGNIRDHLDKVANQMVCDGTKVVLEIISIDLLCEDWFYSYLLNNNKAFVTRKIRYVLNSFKDNVMSKTL